MSIGGEVECECRIVVGTYTTLMMWKSASIEILNELNRTWSTSVFHEQDSGIGILLQVLVEDGRLSKDDLMSVEAVEQLAHNLDIGGRRARNEMLVRALTYGRS